MYMNHRQAHTYMYMCSSGGRIQDVCDAHSGKDSVVVSVLVLGQQSAQVLGIVNVTREPQPRNVFTEVYR